MNVIRRLVEHQLGETGLQAVALITRVSSPGTLGRLDCLREV